MENCDKQMLEVNQVMSQFASFGTVTEEERCKYVYFKCPFTLIKTQSFIINLLNGNYNFNFIYN